MKLPSLWLVVLLTAPSAPPLRIQRLQQWLSAVERHQSRTIDEAADTVRSWSGDELDRVRLDVRSLVSLMRNPRTSTFLQDPDPRNPSQRFRPPPPIPYNEAEIAALRAMAFELAQRSEANRVLMRGALLHTDIAMLVPYEGGTRTDRTNAPLGKTTFLFEDGRPLGVASVVGHWELARRLLDEVTKKPASDDPPEPGRNPLVRLWYEATVALMQNTEYLVLPHFERALELFPEDPDILILSGSVHETLAAPRFQNAVRSTGLARDLGAESEHAELRVAESLYRRALRIDPQRAEVRIRLGRVLGLLQRPAEALQELKMASSEVMDPLLQYYKDILQAREASALRQWRQARAAYEHAAALFPRAQTPRLGLSQLASREGDLTGALSTLRGVLDVAPDVAERDDPWWSYHVAAGRQAKTLLDALYARFPVTLNVD